MTTFFPPFLFSSLNNVILSVLSLVAMYCHNLKPSLYFVVAFWHRDRQHAFIKMINACGRQLDSILNPQKTTTLHCTWGYLYCSLVSLPHSLIPPLSFCLCFFPSCLLCFCALFLGVLEKTVEGEAASLTKAKTLYKSCTNESASAGIRCQHRLCLFISSVVLKWTFFLHCQTIINI